MNALISLLFATVAACPPAAPGGPQALTEARAALQAGRMGEHLRTDAYEKAVVLLRKAAEAGERDAQFELGSLVVSTLFQADAPTEAQRLAYTEALTWLAVAARRGHPKASTYLPPVVTAPLLGRPRPKLDEPGPMSDIPAAWVDAAAAQSAEWAKCWPCAATDAKGLAACAEQPSRLALTALKSGQMVLNHPVIAGPGQTQGYAQLGETQILLISAKPVTCKGAMTASGMLSPVTAPRGYQGWALYADAVVCAE
jgi:hypothetical protein